MAKKKDDIITRADGSVVKIGGYIAPDKKSKANFYKATLKASKLPPKVDLRSMMTAVENQGEIGSAPQTQRQAHTSTLYAPHRTPTMMSAVCLCIIMQESRRDLKTKIRAR